MTTNILLWIIFLATLAAYEIFTLFRGDYEPLTPIVVKYVPWYVALGFIGWLFIHFAIRYRLWDKIKWLFGVVFG